MSSKTTFASKFGLIAATVGSAVGLGNVWRFPAETQQNGGAAFLIIYIACVFLLGIPVMLAEFSLGRAGESDAIGSFKHTGASKPWWAIGGLAILTSYLILCFYMVVAGWTLEYFIQSITGHLYEPVVLPTDVVSGTNEALNSQFSYRMKEYIMGTYSSLIYTSIILLINIFVLAKGVQKGIERMSNLMMPLLFLILLVFCVFSMTLPKAAEGLEFFFRPDFSKITPEVILNALGQAFFSLSLGMGILITYSAYYPKTVNLGKTAATVSVLDLLVAVVMGVIIFPAVTTFNLTGEELEGTALVFITLPEVFAKIPGTCIWSALFFLLLNVAAVTSTISIAEVSVSFVQDRFKVVRWKAVLIVILPLFVLSSICSLSLGAWKHITLFGYTIFDFLDMFTANFMLPIVSLGVCIYVGWFVKGGLLRKEISSNGMYRSPLVGVVTFLIRYIAPILILLVLISGFIN